MPPVAVHRKQPRLCQLPEMSAGGLRRDSRRKGKLACGHGTTIQARRARYRGSASRLGRARMSWWLTMLLHRFPAETTFEEQMRVNQFDYLHASEHAQASLAEQYVGLPFEA